MSHRSARRFTLIEMLVVIAIIAILAGMLSGPILRARESGLAASCKNLVKQYGLATVMYTNDWDGWLPDTANYLSPASSFSAYFGTGVIAQDYARCPGDGTTASLDRLYEYRMDDERGTTIKVSIGGVGSVLSNSQSATREGLKPMFHKISNRAFTRSGSVISWTDYQHNDSSDYNGAVIGATQGKATDAGKQTSLANVVFRHDGSANASFLDGHIGTVTFINKGDLDNNGHDLKSGRTWAGTGNMSYPYGPRPENVNNFGGKTVAIGDITSNVSVTFK